MIDPSNYEYEHGKLVHNFEKVQNPDNWKMPTEWLAVDTQEEAKAIQRAVIHFTGSVPDVEYKEHCNRYLIHPASGYYSEIGA